MTNFYERCGMGWLPDFPDFRDYTPLHDKVAPTLKAALLTDKPDSGINATIDLRQFCSPIEDQGALGSCTANAGAGLVEYFERRAFGRHLEVSRLFLYKVTRNLMRWTGDTGAFLRSTMGAMVLFGVPPEEYWPYNIRRFEEEPTAFCYSFAQNFQSIKYLRLDPPGTSQDGLLGLIKTYITRGFPAMFGFTVFDSLWQANQTGKIPMPHRGEKVVGGHAVVAVGFDDSVTIRNADGGSASNGALIIRNSWGAGWGEAGYGYLPYDYVLSGLAEDFWTLVKNEWVDTNQFGK